MRFPLLLPLFGSVVFAYAPAVAAAPIAGLWMPEDGDSAALIGPCGSQFCGRIVWLKRTVDAQGKPLVDKRNPDPALQSRSLCGLPIITGLTRRDDAHYEGGKVYSAGSGKSYSLNVEMAGPDKIRMRGYIGMPMFGQTFTMTRVKADLPHCTPA